MANVTKSADFSKPCKLYCSWLHNFLTSTFSSLPNLIVAILSLSLLYFPLFLTFNIWGDTIRGHQITVDTIPAHNFGINKFLHPSAITKFYIYFFPAKNTGSYSAQKPENPLKLGLFARANTPSQRYFRCPNKVPVFPCLQNTPENGTLCASGICHLAAPARKCPPVLQSC